MQKTKIEWTNMTWNPVTGCNAVSPGCDNCYAKRMASRFWKGRSFGEIKMYPERIEQPSKWKKPKIIFVCSMGDLFHDDVDEGFIRDLFIQMNYTEQHVFQILTKRPERMRRILTKFTKDVMNWPYPNVWIGVTTENQEQADKRIPILLDTPAKVRWVSCEPILSFICLSSIPNFKKLDWVVGGGETGPGARFTSAEWLKFLCRECKSYKIPFFFKHWGSKVNSHDFNLYRKEISICKELPGFKPIEQTIKEW